MAKVCKTCWTEKPLTEYHRQPNSPDGLRYSCKKCVSARERERYKDPRYKRKQRRASTKWKYGITWDKVEAMFAEQGGGCAICSRVLSLEVNSEDRMRAIRVDHCHTSGQVRGLLCDWCNTGIARFDDNPGTLRAAAKYLEKIP